MSYKYTPPLSIDTDILRFFYGVDELDWFREIFENQKMVPKSVIIELEEQEKFALIQYCESHFDIVNFTENNEILELYIKTRQEVGIGKAGAGEIACLVLAKFFNGCIASNNYKDIADFCNDNDINYFTFPKILIYNHIKKANCKSDSCKCYRIYSQVLALGAYLPYPTFNSALQEKDKL
jgi:hypothetical protein